MSYFKVYLERVNLLTGEPLDKLPGCVPGEATPVVELPLKIEEKANPWLKLLKGIHLNPWEFCRDGEKLYIFREAARLFLERLEFGCRECGASITGAEILSAAEED